MNTWARIWQKRHRSSEAEDVLSIMLEQFVEACTEHQQVCVEHQRVCTEYQRACAAHQRASPSDDTLATDIIKGAARQNAPVTGATAEMLRWALAVKAAPDKAAQAADKAAQAANDAKQAAKKAALAIDNYLLSAVPAIPVAPRSAPLDPLLLAALMFVVVDAWKEPHLHPKPPSLECPPVFPDDGVVEETEQLQKDALRDHHRLKNNRFPQAKFPGRTAQPPRYVEKESALGPVFETEILARAFKILEAVRPFATARVCHGDETNHADMFVVVKVDVEGEPARESAVLVELKLPPGVNNIKPVPACEDEANGFEFVAAKAKMLSAKFTKSVVGQVHADARDTTKACFVDVRGRLNVDYAFVSTFNDLWVLRFEKDPTESEAQDAACAMAAEVYWGAATNETYTGYVEAQKLRDGASRVYVSPRFRADSKQPHIAFAVANTLAKVADAMVANPGAYTRQDTLRAATYGDTVIPPPRDKRKQDTAAKQASRRAATKDKGKAPAQPPPPI
ncbi:hypothetical protein GGF43_000630 [Coemansia sp. RSA 2618]|nr:hypothetical protein GGF43_000630 [Coemansia sp. RSA 2618]